ncbi:FG-GAP-like repeat-containing protein [Hymenobacter negativus]|uniref:FG-GAP repeat protein n=1 Tax=Hymenobacter negativus TaxID=2795026 RepID=A0ABS3QMH5_9BACT|nr:FG-GAP-like repeat-containing protein [Hymenobacter negativus]MBO2012480.1 FG-GAP repeat protein [Hymenobacter negativus]
MTNFYSVFQRGAVMARLMRTLLAGPVLALLPLLAACTHHPTPKLVRHTRAPQAAAHPAGAIVFGASQSARPAPADTSHGALTSILADVRHRSFCLTPAKAAGLTADNYRQRLGARLSASSYTVASRTTDGTAPAWQVRWTLRGIGRAGALALRPVADTLVRPTLADGHATYQQPGFAVDYDNTEAGVRQTFRLAARPAGIGPVQVQLVVATALHARLAGDSAVVFSQGEGNAAVLRYASLRAWDATGRTLPAHLRLGSGGTALALEVDDAEARYPLTIDPLASTAGTTLTGANAGDAFATSVALVGDLDGDGYGDLAVGAPGYNGGAGVALLYKGSSTGLVPTVAFVINGAAGNNLGSSVAGAGDFNGDGYGDLLIGGAGFTISGNNAGVVYIYAGSANFFTNSNPSAAAAAGFTNSRGGTAVAGVGDLNGDGYDDFASGGPDYDAGSTNTGSIRIFFGNASLSVGITTATVGGAANYHLGASLTGLGDTNGDGYADLAVGAPGVSSALVVRGANSTAFNGFSAFYLTPTGGSTAGTSVAGPGDVNGDGLTDVLLGAPGDGTSGSVYLFLGSTSLSGTSTQAAVFSTAEPGESFGQAVSGAGDLNGDGYADFVVGAPAYAGNKGRVYVSLGAAVLSTISNMPQILDGATAGDKFGSSLSGGDANGDGYGDVLVGAPLYASNTGRAYAYYGSPAALAATPTALTEPSASSTSYFGLSTSNAGDVNGDGYADVLVGAYGTGSGQGRAYLYLGSSTGLAANPIATLAEPGAANNNYFGYSVAGAGDVNGDGYADVLVGAYGTSNSQGRTYLYLGSSTGLTTTPTITLTEPGAATNNYFGWSTASAGDVNGDGYADVLVGAYRSGNKGQAYLYRGSSTGLASTPTTLTEPGAANTNGFGYRVAGAGDVNGDGYADVLVGANGTSNNQGRAYFYLGSGSGLASTPTTLTEPGAANNDRFGQCLAGAGDVNGDGYADVLVAAYGTSSAQGRAYFYPGSSTGLAATPTTLTEPGAANLDNFGFSVAGAGDVNGDGYADVLVTATGTSSAQGRAYYYLGSSTGLVSAPTTLTEPSAANGNSFGWSTAGAGDVDGDGYADVLVAATSFTGAGRAYCYRGNQGVARAGALRLYNTNLSSPISASNRANAQFGVGLMARNSVGRIQARIVWEVVGQGQSFSQSARLANSTAYTGRGAWTALPATGTATELKTLVTKAGRASRVRARLEYASSPLAATTPTNGVGGTASRLRYGPWTYVAAQQQGLSASAATPLPVELTAFTATPEGAAVRLAWATASEKNSQAFEVERSLDGRTFARIGMVAAAGTSSSARRYELPDAQLPTGAALLYYRLRQVDLDGTAAYSPVRTVALKGVAAGLDLYPNPAHGQVSTLTGALPGTVVTVTDALGRLVATATADAAGTATLLLPVGLPAGVYVVRAGAKAVRLTVE